VTATLANVEALREYDVKWRWADGDLEPGFTAVLRVKDEARNLPFVLPPLFRALGRVLLVDNESTDGTPDVARELATQAGHMDALEVVSYPFPIARCGTEHLTTPPNSVNSLTYFYNWAFAQVRTSYALKWDGDMVLSTEGEEIFRDLGWQLEGREVRLRMMRIPLYVESVDCAFGDTVTRAFETFGWPNTENFSFGKFLDWEHLVFPPDVPTLTLPDGVCFELKHLDTDEFTNWSEHDFDSNPRLRRKSREWQVVRRLRSRDGVEGLVPFAGDGAEHVVDVARRTSVPEWDRLRRAATSRQAERPRRRG
jgi:glycosyltransferase involved in cell wall biosynthesis